MVTRAGAVVATCFVAPTAADTSPDAYEKLVDRYLNSPHYGERMALYWHRHWVVSTNDGSVSDKWAYAYRNHLLEYSDFGKYPNASFKQLAIEMTTKNAAMSSYLNLNANTKTKPNENYTILEAKGRGHFVGAAMFMQNRRGRGLGFLEGDEMIYVDGEKEPSIIGDGGRSARGQCAACCDQGVVRVFRLLLGVQVDGAVAFGQGVHDGVDRALPSGQGAAERAGQAQHGAGVGHAGSEQHRAVSRDGAVHLVEAHGDGTDVEGAAQGVVDADDDRHDIGSQGDRPGRLAGVHVAGLGAADGQVVEFHGPLGRPEARGEQRRPAPPRTVHGVPHALRERVPERHERHRPHPSPPPSGPAPGPTTRRSAGAPSLAGAASPSTAAATRVAPRTEPEPKPEPEPGPGPGPGPEPDPEFEPKPKSDPRPGPRPKPEPELEPKTEADPGPWPTAAAPPPTSAP